MSIKLRFGLLLCLLLLAFFASLQFLHVLEQREGEELLANAREERLALLQQWLQLSSRTLQRFTNDHAQADGLIAFLARPDEAWAREYLDPAVPGLDLRGLWVLRADGAIVYASPAEARSRPPAAAPDLAAMEAQTQARYFFQEEGADLLEVAATAIRNPDGKAPIGWLVAQRRWNESRVGELAAITGGEVRLVEPDAPSLASVEPTRISLERVLSDSHGRPLRILKVSYQSDELAAALETDSREATLFVLFGFLTFFALVLSLHHWVLQPLKRIGSSLVLHDAGPIRGMSAFPHEFGRMALLVESSFTQRDTLKREIAERTRAEDALRRSEAALKATLAERARLGRDLHDGVIQSLYAAGMGLTSIRSLLDPGQVEAAMQIDQTRNALNETIHDVRNFIVGMEPEALKQQTFRQAIASLLEYLQSIRPVRAMLVIDELLAAKLTLDQRVHALLIAREAVSNALRHGNASEVRLSLRSSGSAIEFEIADDGRGFTPDPDAPGLGMGNLAERARELGASLAVDSIPGRGTRLILTIPIPDTT